MKKIKNEKGWYTAKLISIIISNPGFDGRTLAFSKGYRPNVHGSLLAAERDGVIRFENGWHAVQTNS